MWGTRAVPADQALVRRLNTMMVFEQVRRAGPIARAEIAGRTGLNRSTVSSIVNALLEEGLLVETQREAPTIGRPGILVDLNPHGGCIVGIEIGVDFLSVVLTDFAGGILWRRRQPSDPQEHQNVVIQRAEELVEQALAVGKEHGLRPLGIGLGVPGLVNFRQGKLLFAPNLRWRDVPFRLLWTQRFGLPVIVENEANAGALGEYYYGAARGVENFIFLSAGVGLGGGIIIHGELFRGSGGYAGEIGHMRIQPEGDLCGCGRRGCWETLVGPRAIVRRVRALLEEPRSSLIRELVQDNLDALSMEIIVEAARRGDEVALDALRHVGYWLGVGMANLVNAFNTELFVLGGALNLAGDFLCPVIESVVQEEALAPALEVFSIKRSAHGTDACVMGLVALVVNYTIEQIAGL